MPGIIFRASPDSVDSWENKSAGMESDKRRRQHLIPQFPFYRMRGRRSDGGEATGRGGETERTQGAASATPPHGRPRRTACSRIASGRVFMKISDGISFHLHPVELEHLDVCACQDRLLLKSVT